MTASPRSVATLAPSDAAAPPGADPARPLKLGIVVASVSRKGGGVQAVLRSLGRTLHRPPRLSVEVFGLADEHTEADRAGWGEVPVVASAIRGPAAFGWSTGLDEAIDGEAIDVVHVHGLWMYVSLAARRWHARTGRPFVVSPHGHLDPWALRNAGWKKLVAGFLFERANLRASACIHALCEAEHQAIRAYGLRNPVAVIPNGVDPPPPAPTAPPAWRAALPADAKVLLFLGRVDPQKGLLPLVEGWARLQAQRAEAGRWHLVIAGPAQDRYARTVSGAVESLNLGGRVHVVGPQFGAEKEATFAAADAFVLPSVSEGLPMAVLEAWARGLPAILTDHCHLPEGWFAGAAIRTEPNAAAIAGSLGEFVRFPPERLRVMSAAARALVARRFSWPAVAADLEAVYRWVAGETGPPACVRFD